MGQVRITGLWNPSLFKSWLIQINKKKNPEIFCKMPAACLLVAKELHLSQITLSKKNTKAVIHCEMIRRFVLVEAKRIPKEITTIAYRKHKWHFPNSYKAWYRLKLYSTILEEYNGHNEISNKISMSSINVIFNLYSL